MEFQGHVSNSHHLSFPPDVLERRRGLLASLKPGAAVTETIKRYYPKKTYQQVKTIWGLLVEYIKNGMDDKGLDLKAMMPHARIPDGVPVPREVIMATLYACCNDVGEMGERKTLSAMNTIEAATFFDRCRDHAAQTWGIIVPDPDPTWREKAAARRTTETT